MRGQRVAHCDLRPENVVVDLHIHQLSIVDYDLATFLFFPSSLGFLTNRLRLVFVNGGNL